MITLEDCVAFGRVTEEEVPAIAHEHLRLYCQQQTGKVVCTENLNQHVMVMQAAEYRARADIAGVLNRPWGN